MAWRLRKAQVSSVERVRAIGIEANIGPLDLDRFVPPTMEQLGWVQCDRRPDGGLVSVAAFVPPNAELLGATDRLLGAARRVENLGLTWAFPRPVQADIFPMTSHVECVAILEPAQKGL
ncbi:hypothetical protein [Streptomyces sp. NBC_00259]|uniref:hypothetical protein n=1 Tax=Streptomyces sp. NBC_00259 TaxID=2903643 RepID=UPI002E2D0E71|nr:hypothetical protein [Streptomyces sp. NBC_00259]